MTHPFTRHCMKRWRIVWSMRIITGKFLGSYGTNVPSYDGEFKNDMRHGTGTGYSETGEVIYQGKWKNNDYA